VQKQFTAINLSAANLPTVPAVDMLKQFTLSLQVEKDKTYQFNINASVTDVRNEENPPKSFGLQQNYPNPFNPVTTIQYDVASSQQVILKVYDILGKEVITLVNEKKAPGSYTVDFSSGKLASGTYLYRLQAGDFVQTMKMIILK